jgi:hypothetical protein
MAAIASIGLLISQGAAGAPRNVNAEDRLIRAAIGNGLLASQTGPLAPKEQRGKKLAAATIAELKSNGRANLAKYYRKQALEDRTNALDAAITEEADGTIVFLDSGIDNLVISEVVVSGNTATAKGSGEVWLDVGQVQPDGSIIVAHPRNTMLFGFALSYESGAWQIVAQDRAFAPGSEP